MSAQSEILIPGRRLMEERGYWVERLSRERAPSSLPADRPRPARRAVRSATTGIAVPDDLFRSLGELTRNGPFLIYTTLNAVLQVCLARYAASSKIVVGSPARKLEGAGPTNNVLAILGEIREQDPFSDLLKATRQTLLDAYVRQHYPFHRLLADLGHSAEERQCPLFGVAVALRQIHDEMPEAGHDVALAFNLGADRLAGEVAFDPALFESATIERFVRHYLNVLRSALADPRTPVRDLGMLDEVDQALLAEWSAGPSLPAPDRLVHQLVEDQAERIPDAPAVLSGSDRMSYRELDAGANRLAHHLRRLGVKAESRVAIIMDSSPQAMVAILATLKAGAAYVPLDSKYPKDRVATILSSVRPAALIIIEKLLPELPEHGAQVILVDRDREVIARESASRPAVETSTTGLAYVIHTSGSTGVPNGVMVSHHALLSRVQAMRQIFGVDAATRQLQFASLNFDVSCEEIFPTWICGGAVVLLTTQQRQSGLATLAECDRLGVTKLDMAASVWHNLVDEAVAAGRGVPASLGVSVAGGESPSLEKLRTWNGLARRPLRFFNVYGPTEGTIMAAFLEVALGNGDLDGVSRLPIGRPVPDTRLHLLDAHLRQVPVGVPGELYIGGSALARGYLDRPDLTARSFIPDPWGETPGARLYKTGDLARYDADGLLEFIGRIDFQVKIRGFRVEPGEIEAILRQHPTVSQAVVLAREYVPGDRRLVAYVVPVEGTALDAEELRRHLSGTLSEHMVPWAFVVLDELPLTPNGKIDRRALPAPDRDRRGSSFVAPRTPLEARLAEIWTEVLKLERVGATDNFFHLGGHSLLVTQLVSRINETFQVELPLQRIFEQPTVAELAAQLEAAERTAPDTPPLVPVPRGHRLPLSYAQQRLWFINQLRPSSPFYNVPSVLRLTGRLDVAALESSLNAIIQRHETLRTTFVAEDGHPMQQIHPELVLPLPVLDLNGLPASQREAQARVLIDEVVRRPFDLVRLPLLQAILLRLANDDHVFVVVAHHIVCDGWSIEVFNHELTELYRAALERRQPQLPELPIQYADYAHWQRQWLTGERLERQVDYWRQRLAGATFELALPTDRPRPAVPSFRGFFHLMALSRPLTGAIERLSRDHGLTLFVPLLSAFVALLYRYTGQRDLVVGSLIAGRDRVQTEHLIGFFPNTLLLRVAILGDLGFLALLDRVHEVVLGAFSHQGLPFERVVEELDVARDLSRQPLFQVMFALQNAALESLDLRGLSLAPVKVETGTARFDLTLTLMESDGRLVGGVEYSSDLFDAATIGRFTGHLTLLLEGIVSDPECRISDLPLLSAAERQQVVQDWNDTRAEWPDHASIHALFEAQAARTPAAAALVFDGVTLTYRELDSRSNRLAHQLHRWGVGPEVPVGLLLNSGVAMVVATLAVLKAGGVYVPLDPAYPPERLRLMLDDVRAPGLITLEGLPPGLTLGQRWLLRLDDATVPTAGYDATPPASGVQPANLAYVIYTSGSTGGPKGVAVPHSAVVRLVRSGDYVCLGAADRVAQASNVGFDAATFEIWGALLNGGCLIGISRDEVLSPERLAARLADFGITTLFLTTALFNQVAREAPQAFQPLRQVLFGGEAVDPVWVRKVAEHGAPERLLHVYGPTETTTFAAWQRVVEVPPGASTVPLGWPLANGALHALDASGHPVPPGIAGELYIGGDGLARGYLGQPALSAERFLPDPFSGEPGRRLYRTGDRVRRRPGGEIEFLGRIDRQVKIRGFRIEPGEIEAALLGCDAVRDAAVMVREDEPTGRRLVAFVVAANRESADAEALRHELKLRLPEYMVPSAFVLLPDLPLTASGKIDRQALLAADLTQGSEDDFTPPATPTEELVAEIWSGILGQERIGRDDDFFALGGHSLLATQVVLRVRQALSIELPLHTLFEDPKLSSFVLHVEQAVLQNRRQTRIEPQRAPRDGDLPLSFAQRRLWFLDQLEAGSPFYNMPAAVRLAGRLDSEALARSLAEIQRRHEALRTCFPAVDGEPVQRISPEVSFTLARVDLTALPEDRRDAEAMRRAEEAGRQPFDLSTGLLIRGLLLRLREEDHVVVVTMSHIVADGWSLGVLTHELGVLYDAFSRHLPSPLPDLPIQYADFACWQRQWLSDEVLQEQLRYWRERLRDAPELLALPSDRPRPQVQSFAGASAHFLLPQELSAALRQLSRDQDVTLFMTLLAAFQILLYRQSGQADFCIGTPVANRTLVETEALIGFFVNTLVLRAQLEHRPTFRELLRQVREEALGAYTHQDVPFEMVVEALRPQRSAGHSPLFQVMFNLGNAPGGELQLTGLTLSLIDTELGTSKRDLSLTVSDAGERLRGGFTYSSDLFDATTIRRLAARLEVLLASILEQPDRRADELEILSATERHQALLEWNEPAPEPPLGAKGVHLLFEQQADRKPANVAVVGEGGQLTFSELDARANQLANFLLRRGVGPEVLVALCLERSEETAVALLGVLKAGGAYLPLDPVEPRHSLGFVLGDARPQLLVTQARLRAGLPAACPETVLLDADWPLIARESSARPASRTGPDHLLYVIYTSGSTGQPKGVPITHRQMLNYLAGLYRRLDLPPGAGYAMVSTLAADLGCTMLYPALTGGGCLHLLPEHRVADPAALAEYFERHAIDALKIVPSHLAALMTYSRPQAVLPRQRLVLGGEASRWEWIEQIQALAPDCLVLNHYGPTETTVGVMTRRLERATGRRGPVPLGRPIANAEVYVLDRHLRPVPIGVTGQLHIGGIALARGYLDRPALTAERFIPDPFSSTPGDRLYQTGDLARHLPDGNVEFLGRADHQVKLRGFRIELGEIESVLVEHPRVREAVAMVREEADGSCRLVAYVVSGSTPEPAPSATELRDFLRERLAEHMVPAAFVPLTALPLTPNGKVDRRALPAPGQAHGEREQALVPPRDALEIQLVQIWQDLLGVQSIGIDDDFFDLGGHSLLAVTLMARIESATGKRPTLAALLQQATVAHLASVLRQEPSGLQPIVVEMQPRGTRKPFFCVHPAGGSVLSYLELARLLAPDQPFYALQADGGDNACRRVGDLAGRYLAEILAAQPTGPYYLGGHSFGGVVAYEMARQLQAQGHTVALLVLLDSMAASPGMEWPRDGDAILMANFALHLGLPVDQELLSRKFAKLTTEEQLAEVMRRAKQAGLVPAEMRHDEARHLLATLESHVEARSRYVPQPYAGRVTLFRAHEQLLAAAALRRRPGLVKAVRQIAGRVADPEMGWGGLGMHGVEVHELPGNHFSMLRPPHVSTLAGELRACLERAHAETATLEAS